MILTNKMIRFFLSCGSTDDASCPLTRRNSSVANALVREGLAILILKAGGGADIALTRKGVETYETIIANGGVTNVSL